MRRLKKSIPPRDNQPDLPLVNLKDSDLSAISPAPSFLSVTSPDSRILDHFSQETLQPAAGVRAVQFSSSTLRALLRQLRELDVRGPEGEGEGAHVGRSDVPEPGRSTGGLGTDSAGDSGEGTAPDRRVGPPGDAKQPPSQDSEKGAD